MFPIMSCYKENKFVLNLCKYIAMKITILTFPLCRDFGGPLPFEDLVGRT